MKCSLDRFDVTLKIFLLKLVLTYGVINMECVVADELSHEDSNLMDFDYLVSQLYLQHCTFVEIGEGICSMFVELTVNNGCKKSHKQMFFGNCLCSEFQKWHLCNYHLTSQRPEDCTFQEGTTCPSTSARVHRRLCDVTGMTQWNPQCNCSVSLADNKQDHLCGFRTCYVSPMPKSICGPLTVCGTAHCDLKMHGALYSVRCDRKCRYHQPFCEDPCPATTHRRSITSEWAEWRSVTSPDSNCNIKQFETECLNERKEPAYDCIGPGLLCCGKYEADCTCEVKVQDGRLKAFRYMITFGDNNNTQESRLKVRSTGIKGNAKVWNRFIGVASKEEKADKEDSISMFGKPLGLESYRGNYIPDGKKNIAPNVIDVSLQDSGKTDARLIQQLASLITNRSQSHKNIQDVNLHNASGINSTAKSESLDSKKFPTNQTSGLVNFNPQGQQLVKPNGGQLQITPNNSTINTNLNPNLQNQQKNTQQINEVSKEKSPNLFTPLPNNNITKSIILQEKNSSSGQNMTVHLGNISNDINQKLIKDAKSSTQEGVINNQFNTSNNSTEHQQSNIQKLSESNQQKESGDNVPNSYIEITKNSSINNVEKRPDMSISQNIQFENPMVTTHQNSSLNEMKTNQIENSLESKVENVKNEIKTNEQQSKETKDYKESLEILNYINSSQNPLSIKSDTQDDNKLGKTIDDNKQYKEEKVDSNTKVEKIENDNQDEDSPTDDTYLESIDSEIKSDNLKNSDITPKSQEKYFKDGSKLNSDINREKYIQESEQTENVVNQEELSEIQVMEDKAKSQEKSSVHDEDKTELNGNSYYQVVFPEHGEQYIIEQEKKEIVHSETSKIINQEITPTKKGITTLPPGHKISTERYNLSKDELVSKEFKISTLYKSPMSLSQNKQQNTSGLSNPVKFTTVGLDHNKVSQMNTKNNEKSIDDQNSQKSLLNKIPNTDNILYKNTNITIAQGQNKEEASTKNKELAENKKGSLNDVASIAPMPTSHGTTVLSLQQRPRPDSSHVNEIEQSSQKNLPNGLADQQKINSSSVIPNSNVKLESVNKQILDQKTPLDDISNILPNGSPYIASDITKKPRVNPHIGNENENEEDVIKLDIQTKTTPDLWGSIARKLFKSHSHAITGDEQNLMTVFSNSNPSIVLPEENPSNDYDEPEPVLKDLNKVDKDNVDEKMAEALSKIADLTKLPGKVEWSENHNYKSDFDKNKNQQQKESANSLKKTSVENKKVEKGRRPISKLKPI